MYYPPPRIPNLMLWILLEYSQQQCIHLYTYFLQTSPKFLTLGFLLMCSPQRPAEEWPKLVGEREKEGRGFFLFFRHWQLDIFTKKGIYIIWKYSTSAFCCGGWIWTKQAIKKLKKEIGCEREKEQRGLIFPSSDIDNLIFTITIYKRQDSRFHYSGSTATV